MHDLMVALHIENPMNRNIERRIATGAGEASRSSGISSAMEGQRLFSKVLK